MTEELNTSNVSNLFKFTRLYIAGFPKYLNENRLRSIVEKFGTVTDLTIKRTPNGKSREFGFVGFETHEAAKKALKALDNSFIDTRRILVKEAQARGASTLRGTAWSNWTQGEESFKKVKEIEKKNSENSSDNIKKKVKDFYDEFDILNQGKQDSQLREFIGLGENKQAWKNDIFENEQIGPEIKSMKKKQNKDQYSSDSSSDDEEYNTQSKNKDHNESKSDSESNIDENDDIIEKKKKASISKMSDADFLKSIQKDNDSDSSDSSDDEKDENEDDNVKYIDLPNGTRKKIIKRKIDVMETGRLFLRNLGYTWTEKDVYELFSGYGNISSVHVPIDPQSKKGTGFAFATFMFPEEAKKALESLDGVSYKGRIIHILPAENPRDHNIEEIMNREDLTYKQKLEAKRKSEKENKNTWNSLYMRSDTVAESISKQLGVDKRDFLGDSSKTDRMAVRMAKAEAEIIKQTTDSLKAHGVDFSILSKVETNTMRSQNSILIKNIPPNTNATEIEQLFQEYGELERVVIPPSGTIALVKFYHNNDAKRAFNRNAFKKFKHVPLFLEWAPQAVFTKNQQSQEQSNQIKEKEKFEPTKDKIVRLQVKENDNPENATLFVSNISFNTEEDEIKSLFQTCGHVVNVRLLPGKRENTHRGSGFVTFSNLKDASKAHDKLQNYVINNHAIIIQYSNISKNEQEGRVAVVDGKTLTFKKIIVKNLPFQATRKELYELFSQYGKIDNVRLPQKVAGGHRGFAFVEFVSPEECHSAYEALKNVHLYGRHLVLQYAADDNSLESAQKRARESMEDNLRAEKSLKRQKREFDL